MNVDDGDDNLVPLLIISTFIKSNELRIEVRVQRNYLQVNSSKHNLRAGSQNWLSGGVGRQMGTNSFQGKNIIYQLFFLKEIINIVNENLNHVTLSMMKIHVQ